jgi:hypothetical protein
MSKQLANEWNHRSRAALIESAAHLLVIANGLADQIIAQDPKTKESRAYLHYVQHKLSDISYYLLQQSEDISAHML